MKSRISYILKGIILILLLPVYFHQTVAQNLKHVNFQGADWVTTDTGAETGEGGRHLVMESGIAFLNGIQMAEGTVEVEIAATEGRAFPGIIFHLHKDLHYEEVFLRTHKSGQGDALQYNPVFYQFTNWQIYPEYQASVEVKNDGWNRLKVVFDSVSAAVFINDIPGPVLDIPQLVQDVPNSSGIGLRVHNGAIFRDFRYSRTSDRILLKKSPENNVQDTDSNPTHTSNRVKKWEISALKSGWPDSILTEDIEWQTVTAGKDGLLDISRHIKKSVADRFADNPFEYVWLRFAVTGSEETLIRLDFEYSDRILIMHEGNKLFEGNNSFRQKGPFFRGDFDKKLQSNAVYIQKKEGETHIYMAVGANANGWAVMAAINDVEKSFAQ